MSLPGARARSRPGRVRTRWIAALLAVCLAGAARAQAPDPAPDLIHDPPAGIGGWTDLAQQRYARGDLPGALAALDRAVRQYPNDPQLEFMRANALFRLDRFDEAAAAYTRAGGMRFFHPDTWLGAGFAAYYAGRPDSAVAAFETAVRQSPGSVLARLALALGYQATREPFFARMQLDLATEADPGCDAPERLALDVRWKPDAVATLAAIPPLAAGGP